jgi:hypothetical protein
VRDGNLDRLANPVTFKAMSASELLHQIESLPKQDRLWLWEKLSQLTEADIPESLSQSIREAERGELIDLDEALRELDAT